MEPWMWIVGVVVILVVATLSMRSMRPQVPRNTLSRDPLSGTPLNTAEQAEIDHLVAKDQKILAIKRLREMRPMSLADAKNRIDSWGPASAAMPAPPSRPQDLSPEVHAQVDELVAAGKPIQAIKLVRERTGLGLAEAKAVIDNWN